MPSQEVARLQPLRHECHRPQVIYRVEPGKGRFGSGLANARCIVQSQLVWAEWSDKPAWLKPHVYRREKPLIVPSRSAALSRSFRPASRDSRLEAVRMEKAPSICGSSGERCSKWV